MVHFGSEVYSLLKIVHRVEQYEFTFFRVMSALCGVLPLEIILRVYFFCILYIVHCSTFHCMSVSKTQQYSKCSITTGACILTWSSLSGYTSQRVETCISLPYFVQVTFPATMQQRHTEKIGYSLKVVLSVCSWAHKCF